MSFVLDNSVVTGWYLADQASAYTESIGTLLQNDKALVPALWQLEYQSQGSIHRLPAGQLQLGK